MAALIQANEKHFATCWPTVYIRSLCGMAAASSATSLVATDTSRDDLRSLPANPSWSAVQTNRLFIARADPATRPYIAPLSTTFPNSNGPMRRASHGVTALGDRSSATWPAGFSAVAICILASLASAALTAITRCSSPFLASSVASAQAAIKNEQSWLPKPSPTPFALFYLHRFCCHNTATHKKIAPPRPANSDD